ncbi:hypothetical protein [Laribacter hongkongensis]|uniref:hypothetical protein n=1 Tax=Laribacter hongkongensis TaxID=168471 RepID=UPI001EFCBB8C|nr:hypothetical protein [Laribacter hongkongensis]MCG9096335.1 hypothetical protein [Laribacter hongkongensis]
MSRQRKDSGISRADKLRLELAGLRSRTQDHVAEIGLIREQLTSALLDGDDAHADSLEAQLSDALKIAGRAEVRETALLQAIDAADREANAGQRAEIAVELSRCMAERAARVDSIARRLDALAVEIEQVRDNTVQGKFWKLLELRPDAGEVPDVPSFGSMRQAARRIALAVEDVEIYADDLAGNNHAIREIISERARRGTSRFDEGNEIARWVAENPQPELPRLSLQDIAGKFFYGPIIPGSGECFRTTETKGL